MEQYKTIRRKTGRKYTLSCQHKRIRVGKNAHRLDSVGALDLKNRKAESKIVRLIYPRFQKCKKFKKIG